MRGSLIVIAAMLTACSLAPEAVIPTTRVPPQWRGAAPSGGEAPDLHYGSAELQKLIATALAHNTDIAAALARVAQARANTRIASAGLYPTIDVSGNASRTTTDTTNTRSVTTDRSDATLTVAYELDLWQRNRSMSEAAAWAERATEFDRDALRLVVTAEVARLYSGTVAYEARVAVATKNLRVARDVLRITELRHRAGAISGLELAQQRTSIGSTEATVAALQNQRDLFFNQLALVVGRAPSQLQLQPDRAIEDWTIPTIALADPWALLARRPDIAAAEARLRAAHKDIGTARANALPRLSLAMNAGVVGDPSGTLFGLAGSFFAPIFQGGALQGAIDFSEAARDELSASFETTLLVAFREVEDALSTVEAAATRREALRHAAEAARQADQIARARFKAGAIDYTTLLQTQTALLQADDNYYAAVQDQLAAHIDLVRALGGNVVGDRVAKSP